LNQPKIMNTAQRTTRETVTGLFPENKRGWEFY
jgi:hypothetical protein